ncbi:MULTISPECIES: ABC transporter permease [Streptomyces]|uniref:Transport permease protein n=1 Tax=Streptomyces sviceus (strain ATCC 29083 / DSM 924 / JCM 4929 / NBRC 13980 / NCIMB 11184 / NRRL 5439 / UC 5370) TaxID=463191 RepID=B5HU42_STRX2|nr:MULTISPECIES: ABC transporter permease [Streptomyces]EDY56347.1 integral membrane protein [Streptomyces sviceus ATCC 29083]MYT06851.1 ABC transporter permease [Streptomyces sp. SID5470]
MSTLTTPAGRLGALARAEFTLLGRSKATLLTAVLVPLALPFSLRSVVDDMDVEKAGLSIGTVLLPAAIGFALLFGVYSALVAVFTARREELVLKRLRTGELGDVEILCGTALPIGATGLVQSLVLIAGSTALLDLPAPHAPYLAVLGLLLGLVMCAALAALTAAVTRTVESAQVTSLPFVLLSMALSGVTVPLELLPDRLASVCELLPLSPVITLVRGGWTGTLSLYEALGALATAVAWTVPAVFAVGRWFRWEPRR